MRRAVVVLTTALVAGCSGSGHDDPPALTPTADIQAGSGHCSRALFDFTAPEAATLARSGPTSIDVCQLGSDGQVIGTTARAAEVPRIASALSALPEWHGEAINCPAIPVHPATEGFLLHYGRAGHVFVRFGPGCDSVASLDGYRRSRGFPTNLVELLHFTHG